MHRVEAVAAASAEVVRVIAAEFAVGPVTVVEHVAVAPVAVVHRSVGVVVVAVDIGDIDAGVRPVMVEVALAGGESNRGHHDGGETLAVTHLEYSLQPSARRVDRAWLGNARRCGWMRL